MRFVVFALVYVVLFALSTLDFRPDVRVRTHEQLTPPTPTGDCGEEDDAESCET